MLIKIVAMFRNLLISSFDATIRVKRAFHPAPASRGFASHVFLVYYCLRLDLEFVKEFSVMNNPSTEVDRFLKKGLRFKNENTLLLANNGVALYEATLHQCLFSKLRS